MNGYELVPIRFSRNRIALSHTAQPFFHFSMRAVSYNMLGRTHLKMPSEAPPCNSPRRWCWRGLPVLRSGVGSAGILVPVQQQFTKMIRRRNHHFGVIHKVLANPRRSIDGMLHEHVS